MKNNVSDAELSVDPNLCQLSDIEICERGVDEVSFVDEDGNPTDHKETWMGEAEFAYYYCNECGEDWRGTAMQDQAQCWKLAKEHLNVGVQ